MASLPWRRGNRFARNRQTIIALRARHTSHRLASDLLHQPMTVPPQPVVPLEAGAEGRASVGKQVFSVEAIRAKGHRKPPYRLPSKWEVLIVIGWVALWTLGLIACCVHQF